MIVQETGVLERHAALMLTRELHRHPQLDLAQAQELTRVENLLCTNDPSDLAAITRELRTIGRQLDERQAQLDQLARLVDGPEAPAVVYEPVTGATVGTGLAVDEERVAQAQRLLTLVAMSTVIGSVVLIGGLILLLSMGKLFVATPLAVAALVTMFKALATVARQHRLECELVERAQVRAVRAELIARGVTGPALEAAEHEFSASLTAPTAGVGFSLDRALRGRGSR